MKLSSEKIKHFQTEILVWYEKHKRELPWRRTRDPYKILVSEVMSQQTQIQRVIPKYEAWIEVFPTVESLAKARTSDVLRLWSGLGYNRRALNLQKAARVVVNEYKGDFPKVPSELEKLPGIGRYTAQAVSCFAYDAQVAVIDTNVRKVIAVEFFNGVLPTEKVIEETAQKILPKGRAYEWNQALMDYAGATLRKHKIPATKQSHFLTSNRYFRGQTMKYLLTKHKVSFKELHSFFTKQGREIEKKRLERILQQLHQEGFLVYEKVELSLTDL